jgi:hypothetical protein
MGLQERGASGAAALAGRGHAGRQARAEPRGCRGTWPASLAVWGRGRLVFPLAKAAVRAWPRAGRAQAASSTASRPPRACRWRRAPRPPMGTSAPQSSRCWRPCTSAPAHGDERANASRCWRRIRGMVPETSARASAHAGCAPSSRNGCGRPEGRVGDRANRASRAFTLNGHSRGSHASTAAWSSAGNVWRPASRRSSPSPSCLCGSKG